MNLTIEKVVYGGNGLARASEGLGAIFVPFTLPGEKVEAQEIQSAGGRREAELVRVVEPSAGRTEPKCQHFGQCGGCQYQHAVYQEQLKLKRAILRESLERSGLRVLPEITIHSGEPWEYRNRIRLHITQIAGTMRV